MKEIEKRLENYNHSENLKLVKSEEDMQLENLRHKVKVKSIDLEL